MIEFQNGIDAGIAEDASQIPTYSRWPIELVSGTGSYVTDSDGKSYLDFYGGHCVALLGHCHPTVVDALKKQAETLLFYSNVVYSDVRAVAAEKLLSLAGPGADRVYFCNSGTEANETALKIARKKTGKQTIIATENGFHGRTLGSLAVTWNPSYRDPYGPSLAETLFVPFGDAGAIEKALGSSDDIAAVIIEPIQSMAGMVTAPAEYFRHIRTLCHEFDVLLVFDEIQTGAGRTGTFLYSERLGVTPDMTTLAKSLGSGVPVGAVLTTEEVALSVRPGDHGSTFGGGMLATAAVSSTLAAIESEGVMQNVILIFDRIQDRLSGQNIIVRGAGCLIGLQFNRPVAPIIDQLREYGILVGGSSDSTVIRLMPPGTATLTEVDIFIDTLLHVIDDDEMTGGVV